ncbi:hypothetical protein [Aliifodinibius salipaludis]|nr:hypothetical protein [Aliifodinibius salipaludis]
MEQIEGGNKDAILGGACGYATLIGIGVAGAATGGIGTAAGIAIAGPACAAAVAGVVAT